MGIPKVSLTKRQTEVLQWAARGKSCWTTGQLLDISPETVDFHRNAAMERIGFGNITSAVARAVADGLIDPP